jgi:7-cyano-7-deazaguanine synthase in queuosine biosynthesis
MTNASPKLVKVFCGELCRSIECTSTELNLLNRDINGFEANITIGYAKFVKEPENLPPRILDLLQIAAHVFCADRLIYRGGRDSISNKAWGRSFEFHIPVLDYDFWSNQTLQNALSDALVFMTGDRKYSFVFEKSKLGHLPKSELKQLSLFGDAVEQIDGTDGADVLLFSGGLDSLAGAIERLNTLPDNKLIVVSHKANNSVTNTQKQLVEHLKRCYENRVFSYGFECHNKNTQVKKTNVKEETQRTRMFLYSTIAFAICNCANKHSFYVYENGITSINLPTQADVVNARASRTTHPKTLGLMKKVFRFFDTGFDIIAPYYNKTKEDVFKVFTTYDEKELLRSSVSCSSTREHGIINHCGCCSQCIDRHFAAYASGLNEYDVEYTYDFITQIPNENTKQQLWLILRMASAEKLQSPEELFKNFPEEMVDLLEYWYCDNPDDSLADIFSLFSRYGDSVMRAAKAMQFKHEDLRVPIVSDSFLSMLTLREYLNTPTQIRVKELDRVLRTSIPQVFHASTPKDENDFNNKVKALLTAAGGSFSREYPVLKFGISSYRADLSEDALIIESKYLRGKTPPSVATESIAADITKIPNGLSVLFIVYDPERKITDDAEFINSYEQKRQLCFVRIYR